MKKTVLFFVLALVISFGVITGCKQNSPTAPAATATPANVEGTVVAVLTNVAIANATNTKVAQETATAAAGLYTATLTSTSTQIPNATLTVQAILTSVGAGNATATEQAQETETAVAGLYTATLTGTSTQIPNMTQTIGAILTAVGAGNATATEQAQETQTAIAILYTPTLTSTSTQIPNATLTVQAILTVVGAGNATATEQAQETQTSIAILYTATLTSTITPSPNQTGTAEAIGTMIANIHESETEAVILSRTPTPTATSSITPTFTVTDTYTATPTVTFTITNTATPTITATSTVTLTSTSTPTPIPYSDFVSVPGGTFTQTDGTNSFSHTISAFKMGKYQVTYDLWYAVYQWAVANGYSFADAGTGSGYKPVTFVSWRDVIVWCNAYSQEAGLTPCYTYSSAAIKDSTNATACDNVVCVWTNNGYRLPSEGEYQYAGSYIDGTSWTPYNYASGATADYTNSAATGLVAWYSANCSSTQAVGGKTANALGIYDMSGNVYIWCWDWYGTYPTTAQTDYRGPANYGGDHMVRGGDYFEGASPLKLCYRGSYSYPYSGRSNCGFRFARTY